MISSTRNGISPTLRAVRGAAAAALTLAVALGCGDFSGQSTGAAAPQAAASPASFGPVAGRDPVVGLSAFESTAYPLLTQYCGTTCHVGGGTEGTPFIAHFDPDTAYHAVVDNQKVNLAVPDSSRLVRRLVADLHHCWADCTDDGAEMEAAIAEWAQLVTVAGAGTAQLTAGISSGALTLADGIEDLGSERYMDNLVGFWDFKEGTGDVAHDTSGVDPALDLLLEGPEWMSSYGISVAAGKAHAPPETSAKLYDLIADPNRGTQQYSVEAWVVPDNTDQEGPARIISYSQGTGRRNFTLGQVLYNYDFRNRTIDVEISDNGTPALQTYDGDQDLQATRQHVVISYDQFRGRRIFVNGRWTDDLDEAGPTRLWNWDPGFRFVLGNETSDNRQWVGKIQLVAIYDHALSQAQIQQNFDAGVGKRLIMRFDLSQWLGAGSFIEFSVSELDEFSYLFCEPTIVTSNPDGFRVANLRISVNGQVPVTGQAFVNVDQIVTLQKQKLSSTCSVILKEQGPDLDVFAVEFETLGGFENPVVVAAQPPPPPVIFAQSLPSEGVRDFARINETMAALTQVDPNAPGVSATHAELEQQLPGGFDLRAFSSSNQVGIAKLSLEYCDQLVETPALRDGFFGTAIDFDAPATTAFDPVSRSLLAEALVDGMLGTGLVSQPDLVDVSPILDDLLTELTAGCTAATCGADRTRTVVKAACAAVLGSAAVSIH